MILSFCLGWITPHLDYPCTLRKSCSSILFLIFDVRTETHHYDQSKCHRMLYPLDEPSWSLPPLSKMVHNLIHRRKRKTIKDCDWMMFFVCQEDIVILIRESHCEIRTHDRLLLCCLALPHSSLYVMIMNLELLLSRWTTCSYARTSYVSYLTQMLKRRTRGFIDLSNSSFSAILSATNISWVDTNMTFLPFVQS